MKLFWIEVFKLVMVVVDFVVIGSVCLSFDNNGVLWIRILGVEFWSCGGVGYRGGFGWGVVGVVVLVFMN